MLFGRRFGGLVNRRADLLVCWLLDDVGGRGLCVCTRGGRARFISQGVDQNQLVKPNQVLGSRSLGLFQPKDKPIVVLGVQVGVNLLQLSLVFFMASYIRSR